MPLLEPVEFFSVALDADRTRTPTSIGTIGGTIEEVAASDENLSEIDLSETHVRLRVAWTPTTKTIIETADEFEFRGSRYNMTVSQRTNNRFVLIDGDRSSA